MAAVGFTISGPGRPPKQPYDSSSEWGWMMAAGHSMSRQPVRRKTKNYKKCN